MDSSFFRTRLIISEAVKVTLMTNGIVGVDLISMIRVVSKTPVLKSIDIYRCVTHGVGLAKREPERV